MRALRRVALLGATTALLLSGTGIATADQIYNNLDGSIDAVAETMPLNASGPSGTTTLAVNPANGDGKNGCNLTGSKTLVVSVASSDTSVATVSPSSVTFTSCSDTQTLTVTPHAEGSSTVSLSQVSNSTDGTFDLGPATFTVSVTAPAPANTAPSVSVDGVTDGASYNKGSVPAATCKVTDAEDGNSSFAASLSAVTGPDAVDGIGSQTASCSYTDAGGLTASSSVTYSIVDPTAPVISYTLNPSSPDGLNGWYTGNVTLKWTVSEPESPNSLAKTGCDDQTITADQVATDYTCSGTSAGGSTGPVTATIKRDGTAPSVTLASVDGTKGTNDWYTSNVTANFTATDATSGPDTQTGTATNEGAEGNAIVLDSPAFSDNAGNTAPAGTANTTVKIDKTAPTNITFSGVQDYYFGDVQTRPTCSADDATSGLASCTVTGGGTATGTQTWTATATDNAGNTTTKSITYTVMAWTDTGFYNPVNMDGTVNTVKGGSTVPLKFNVYAGTELTDTSVVKSFTTKQVSCTTMSSNTDAVEVTSTGGTSLRYDATGKQFIQNWKTPTGAGNCYIVTMTTQDGSALSANFKLK